MPAQFCYGSRREGLVHINDLNTLTDRGLACNCVCHDCGRPLQAHLGTRKAWHFQHHIEDAGCNPQPMTLLHAFVRDQFARRRSVTIPEQRIRIAVDENGHHLAQWLTVAAKQLDIEYGETEHWDDGVQPDVFYRLGNQQRFALEVRFAHAVDEEKRAKLRWRFHESVEFDVSDLPGSGIGTAEIERLIVQPSRWRWLVNTQIAQLEFRLKDHVFWVKQAWHVRSRPTHIPKAARPASAKLRKAQTRLEWARAQLVALRTNRPDPDKAARWLETQDKIDRVAIACAALGLQPDQLAEAFYQSTSEGMGHHPYSWQVVLFMKFGVGVEPFTSHVAAAWAELALPDRVARHPEEQSTNGFTRTAAALHCYCLALEAQGFLSSDRNRVLESRVFKPRFETADAFRRHLMNVSQQIHEPA